MIKGPVKENLNSLITILYKAIITPDLWDSIMEEVCNQLHVEAAYFLSSDDNAWSNNVEVMQKHNVQENIKGRDPAFMRFLTNSLQSKKSTYSHSQENHPAKSLLSLENDCLTYNDPCEKYSLLIPLRIENSNSLGLMLHTSKYHINSDFFLKIKLLIPHFIKVLHIYDHIGKIIESCDSLKKVLSQINNKDISIINSKFEVIHLNHHVKHLIEKHQYVAPEYLKQAFQLTPSEIEISTLLINNYSVADIIETQKITLETLRWRIKQILQKTNTHSKAGLIRLLLPLTKV